MLSESLAALILFAGLALLVAGFALWSIVAGLIVAGLCFIFLSFLWNAGGDEP